MYISVTEKERKAPAPQAEQRLSDARRLYGNYLYVNETSVQSQSERDKTVAGNENGPPSEWGEVQFLW